MEHVVMVGQSLWLILPAYIANSTAVLVGRGVPLDLGKRFPDGKRILGDGKTFIGFFGGSAIGLFAGMLMSLINVDYLPQFTVQALFCLTFGALGGDLLASFGKRRANIERGTPLPIVDQLDFVLGAWFFLTIFALPWLTKNFTLLHVITILILTPMLHKLVNLVGYKLKRKKVPW